jgi:hypothetical protein
VPPLCAWRCKTVARRLTHGVQHQSCGVEAETDSTSCSVFLAPALVYAAVYAASRRLYERMPIRIPRFLPAANLLEAHHRRLRRVTPTYLLA